MNQWWFEVLKNRYFHYLKALGIGATSFASWNVDSGTGNGILERELVSEMEMKRAKI